jgi:two-component system NtrC family sensor kinase
MCIRDSYRVVSELTSDFAYTLAVLPDGSLRTEWITDAFTRITGFAGADLDTYGGWVNFFHADDRGRVEQEWQRLLAGQASIIEVRMRTRQGPPRWVRFHNRPEIDPHSGRVCRIRGAGQDITETKRMEQEVIQAERLAAMGQVMAILAHEIKNPLQAIQGNLDLLSAYELEADEREETLRICRNELRRLTDITQGVLSLSRTGPETYRPVAVAQAWQKTMDLVSKQIKDAGIEVEVDLPADLPAIHGSMEQVVQVLLNLVLNAMESMPNGGRLEIAGSRQGDTVVVAVTDSGPPIPEDHLDRLVEPFFTTKPEGTGLGLFVSHTIMQQHGGSLIATNLPDDQGVRFSIILPMAAKDSGS